MASSRTVRSRLYRVEPAFVGKAQCGADKVLGTQPGETLGNGGGALEQRDLGAVFKLHLAVGFELRFTGFGGKDQVAAAMQADRSARSSKKPAPKRDMCRFTGKENCWRKEAAERVVEAN